MLCLHYEDVSQTALAAVHPSRKTLTGKLEDQDKWPEGSRQFKRKQKRVVNPLTPVTLRRVGQMLSAHDSQLNIKCV